MKVVITGASGQLSRCIMDRIPLSWSAVALNSSELDISNRESVLSTISSISPDVIINAAAYTAVDNAENQSGIASKVNTLGPAYLAEAATKYGTHLFHISTDYVFDGTSKLPYIETDKTNPLSTYGKTKLKGELAVLNAAPNATIIRTSWVFSEYGNNFVKTMLRLAQQRSELNIVNDQFGCPTYAGDLADAIIFLISNNSSASGIYHYCGENVTTWHGFAGVIFSEAKKIFQNFPTPIINPIPTENYPTPATRPLYSVLDCRKIEALGVKRSTWIHQLRNVIVKIGAEAK